MVLVKSQRWGVSLRRWFFKDETEFIEKFANFLKDIVDDFDVYFISFQELDDWNSDKYMYDRIVKLIGDKISYVYWEDYGLDGIESFISSLDYFIGMRYHSIVLAAKYGIPFIALNYWNKVKELARDVSMDEYCIDVGDVSGNKLKRLFESMVVNEEEIKTKLIMSKSGMEKRLEDGIEGLRDFLRGML